MVEQVRNGAIPCTDEEKKMLLAAFDYNDADEKNSRPKCEPNREVQIWPELADCWMKEIFSKKRHMLRPSVSASGSSEA